MNRVTPAILKFYFFCLFLCSAGFLKAQAPAAIASANEQTMLTYTQVDSLSYDLYLKNDWKTLSVFCDQAFKQGYDYYYLRFRAGIACFQLNQFRKAIDQFTKAMSFNSADEVLAGYLYACYLYSERPEEARSIAASINPFLAESMKIKKVSPIDFLNIENGFKLSDSSRLYKISVFSSIGLQHAVTRNVSLFHNFSYYSQEESRFKVQQFQYYLKGTVALKKNVLVSVAAHYINDQTNVKEYVAVTTTVLVTATVQGAPPAPGMAPTTQTIQYVESGISTGTTTVKRVSAGYVASANITKQTTFFNYSLGFTAAFLDTATQYQFHAGLTCFPLKNNRLAFGATVYQHSESAFKTNKLAIAPFISAYPTKHLFLSLTYFNNSGNNVIENTGYLVNNSVDFTINRFLFTASQKIFNNTWLYITYGYETKKHLTESFRYNYNMLLIGFKIFPSNQ